MGSEKFITLFAWSALFIPPHPDKCQRMEKSTLFVPLIPFVAQILFTST